MSSHDIDYEIIGEELQCVSIALDPAEIVVAEAGSLLMMDDAIEMRTIFGSGSASESGWWSKLMSAGKRVLTGESLFLTAYVNSGYGRRHVSFAAPYPGKILAFDLSAYRGKIICQKEAFLCAAHGVSVGIEFQRKLGVGFFGGEGFIMQKLEGDGWAFIHAGGTVVEKQLGPADILRVDTGCLAAFTGDVSYTIEAVRGVRNAFFGGEGLFLATLRGPGKVWVQSMPFSRLADKVVAAAPSLGGKRRGEGSILGGLGDLLDGDNRI